MSDTSSANDTAVSTTQHHTKLDNPIDHEQPTESPHHEIPREFLELEEVDMNDELMDPFEWATRKLIPIPKKYYWEHGESSDNDTPAVDPKNLPLKLKLWHRSVAAGGSALRLVDRMGKPVVGFLGFSSSRFDYVTSTMTEQDWERSRQTVSERRKQQQESQLEEGGEEEQ